MARRHDARDEAVEGNALPGRSSTCPIDHAEAGFAADGGAAVEAEEPSVAAGSGSFVRAGEAPGPRPTPLLGWRADALRLFRDPLGRMLVLRREYGPLVRLVRGGNRPLFAEGRARTSRGGEPGTYFALGSEVVRELLMRSDDFGTSRPPGPDTPSYRRLSENLLFFDGARHRSRRRLLFRFFDRAHLRAYEAPMRDATQTLLDRCHVGATIDLAAEMRRLSLEISGATLFGIDATEREDSLAHEMAAMIDALVSPLALLPIDLPGTPRRRLIRRMDSIAARLDEEIARRANAEGNDFLTWLVRSQREEPDQMTRDELAGQSFLMFFAGHDTSWKALAWILFLLATHPRVQDELRAELQAKIGDGAVGFDDAFRLPVLDRVIREGLRVLTPSALFPRTAARDTTLAGCRVAAGSDVVYSPFVVHRDAEVFPHPARFDPARWDAVRPTRWQYLPFGAGAHSCLGASFGRLQLGLVVGEIVRAVRLAAIDSTRVDLEVRSVVGPRGRLPVRIEAPSNGSAGSPVRVRGDLARLVEFPDR
ncbi:MAG: cytochrome P450 [Acidobacteriota bacterium]